MEQKAFSESTESYSVQPDTAVLMKEAAHTKQGNRLFPVFLKAEQLHVLLVGAGNVGFEKFTALLQNAPATKITIVAKEVSLKITSLANAHENVEVHQKTFDAGDLVEKDLVMIAINDNKVSAHIRNQAKASGLLVNVADKPELCDFYLSSIVQKGQIKIAISTNGQSPTMAKRLKELLQESLPDELDEVTGKLHQVREKLNGNFSYKVKRLNEITSILLKEENFDKETRWKKTVSLILAAFALMLLGHFVLSYLPLQQAGRAALYWYNQLDKNFHWMVLAGFLAQLVDGATSMGYGVTSAIVLMSSGVSPAAISGSIHTAEMFASGASGYSHYRFGNVNKKLFKTLVIPGVAGAVAGAFMLVKFGETHIQYIRPLMAVYTLTLGVRIFINAFRQHTPKKKFKRYGWLAGAGGFLDSFGGGGWGPIVTATLITQGRSPKFTVGSVSLTEFFVTLASAFTFFTLIGVQHWQVIVALIIGGVLAAPLAARLSGKLPRKTSFILLGFIVIIWSVRILIKLL